MVSLLDSGWSGLVFEPWLGSLCCVLEQDTLLSQCLSSPMCIKLKDASKLNAGGNLAMD